MSNDQYNVEHADLVEHSDQTDSAEGITHATHVDTVQKMDVINGTPPPTSKIKALKFVRDAMLSVVVLFALVVMVLVIVDKNHKEAQFLSETTSNRTRIGQLSDQVAQQSSNQSDKLICARRYQDAVDLAQATSTIDFTDLIVLVVQVPATDPGREQRIQDSVAQLDLDNTAIKTALNDKAKYNNEGNPLPCPLSEAPAKP